MLRDKLLLQAEWKSERNAMNHITAPLETSNFNEKI